MAAPKKGQAQMSDSKDFPLIGAAQTLIADIALAYTTDDPGQSAADTTTIADGDSGLVEAEVEQAIINIHAKINAILDVLEEHGLMKAA